MTRPRTRQSFFLWTAIAMNATVLVGFWFTYFGPMFEGTYARVSPLVHVHGWSFFAWYLLLIAQIGLIHSGQAKIHRAVGLTSMALAFVMIVVGVIVTLVRIESALGPDGDPFWALMGLPIFSIWILFTVFYAAAIYYRKRVGDHKRLMLVASAAALSAATFRIVVNVLGYDEGTAIVGTLAPALFIVAGMVYDYRAMQRIHRVYRWGLPAMVGLIGGAFLLVLLPDGEIIQQGLGWLGRLVRPLY